MSELIVYVCPTFNRPRQLGQAIRAFERQSCIDSHLLILSDADKQYGNADGVRWKLIQAKERYPTLGEKRNAATKLALWFWKDAKYIGVFDDDDILLPWAAEATIAALQKAPLSRPSVVLHPDQQGRLHQHLTGGLFPSGWGYTRELFDRVGGYPKVSVIEDQDILARFIADGAETADPIALGYRPFLVYSWGNGEAQHLSGVRMPGLVGDQRAQYEAAYWWVGHQQITPTSIEQWITDPPFRLDEPDIVPGVFPRKF